MRLCLWCEGRGGGGFFLEGCEACGTTRSTEPCAAAQGITSASASTHRNEVGRRMRARYRGDRRAQSSSARLRTTPVADATTLLRVGIWVLDTETKGTGAHRVPLEKVVRRPADRRTDEPIFVPPKRPERVPEPPAPRPPARFKVTDLLTRRTLAEDTGARATVDVLKGVRSSVDVQVSRWDDEAERWRPLTLAQQRALWRLRDR